MYGLRDAHIYQYIIGKQAWQGYSIDEFKYPTEKVALWTCAPATFPGIHLLWGAPLCVYLILCYKVRRNFLGEKKFYLPPMSYLQFLIRSTKLRLWVKPYSKKHGAASKMAELASWVTSRGKETHIASLGHTLPRKDLANMWGRGGAMHPTLFAVHMKQVICDWPGIPTAWRGWPRPWRFRVCGQ